MWSKISSVLPDRSVQACHNVIKRRFHPDNYKGRWTPEEEQTLITLINIIDNKTINSIYLNCIFKF